MKLKPIEALRVLTGMFRPADAVNILALVNILARYLDGDESLDPNFLIDTYKEVGIDLDLEL